MVSRAASLLLLLHLPAAADVLEETPAETQTLTMPDKTLAGKSGKRSLRAPEAAFQLRHGCRMGGLDGGVRSVDPRDEIFYRYAVSPNTRYFIDSRAVSRQQLEEYCLAEHAPSAEGDLCDRYDLVISPAPPPAWDGRTRIPAASVGLRVRGAPPTAKLVELKAKMRAADAKQREALKLYREVLQSGQGSEEPGVYDVVGQARLKEEATRALVQP